MDAEQAVYALREVGDVRWLTRRSVRDYCFPFVLYGTAALVAGELSSVAPGIVGWWWAGTGLVGGALTWRHYRSRALATGVTLGWRRYAIAWAGAGCGMAAVFGVGPPPLYPVLPWAVIGLTYLGLGVTGDGSQMSVVGVALCLIAATALVGLPADTLAGGVLLVAGATSFVLSRRRLPGHRRPGWWEL